MMIGQLLFLLKNGPLFRGELIQLAGVGHLTPILIRRGDLDDWPSFNPASVGQSSASSFVWVIHK